ncbi:hypothetical protein DCC27_010485 [Auritidibacter sp. NML130574]|nr:hypothetical protein DCC27_010485 [Auritidibacter sp. NML130574]
MLTTGVAPLLVVALALLKGASELFGPLARSGYFCGFVTKIVNRLYTVNVSTYLIHIERVAQVVPHVS